MVDSWSGGRGKAEDRSFSSSGGHRRRKQFLARWPMVEFQCRWSELPWGARVHIQNSTDFFQVKSHPLGLILIGLGSYKPKVKYSLAPINFVAPLAKKRIYSVLGFGNWSPCVWILSCPLFPAHTQTGPTPPVMQMSVLFYLLFVFYLVLLIRLILIGRV